MDEDGCGSNGVWNIRSDILLGDAVLSVYYWDYLQVILCDVVNYYSAGMDSSLDQIDYL